MAIDASIYQQQKSVEAPSVADNVAKGMNLASLGMQQQKQQQELQAGDMQAHLQKAQAFGQAMQSLSGMTPEQRAQAYPQVRNELVSAGIAKPQDMPEQHDENFYRQSLMRYQQSAPAMEHMLQDAKRKQMGAETAKIESETIKRRPIDPNSNDPATLVPQQVPKEHQAAVFKEIDAAENTRRMSGSILKAFDDATKDTSGTGALTSMVKDPRSTLALHQAMQPTFKDLEGTVRQAAMDNTFKNITPSWGDSKEDIATKRAALQDYLQSKLSAPTARGYGIDLNKFDRTAALNSPAPEVKSRGLADSLMSSAQAAPPPAAAPAIKPGTADGGYVFMGGDPANPKSWKKR